MNLILSLTFNSCLNLPLQFQPSSFFLLSSDFVLNPNANIDLNLVILTAMLLALSIPIYEAWKDENIWQTMLAFASISTKTAIIALMVSVLRDDWMIGVVAVIILSVGDAGIMLLAHILKRLRENDKYL